MSRTQIATSPLREGEPAGTLATMPYLFEHYNDGRDCFCQDWLRHLHVSGRFASYSSFKSSLQQEKYLHILHSFMLQTAFT